MNEETAAFVDALYIGLKGYAYVAVSGGTGDWKQHFFDLPNERDKLLGFISAWSPHKNVYLAPSLFESKRALKDDWKVTNYVWVEFDGNFDKKKFEGIPLPHIMIQSSTPGHMHCYWRILPCSDFEEVERVNRNLARHLGADYSGHDCNQVLRPPGTHNHKPGKDMPVKTLVPPNMSLDVPHLLSHFDMVPDIPKFHVVPNLEADLLPIGYIYEKHPEIKAAFERIWNKVNKPGSDRSNGLMELAYICAEQKLVFAEIMSVLVEADKDFGKFLHRGDKWTRYPECAERALAKYPNGFSIEITNPGTIEVGDDEENPLRLIGAKSLVEKKIDREWILEDMLATKGKIIVSGKAAVGKSTFSLDAANCLALGLEILGIKVQKPQKVLYLSLEMDDFGLQKFITAQHLSYTPAQRELLEANMVYAALGEPVEFTKPGNQEVLVKTIKSMGFDGIVVDSLSSMTFESLSEEKPSKEIMGWLAHVQQDLSVWTWIIHHNKKAESGLHGPTLMDLHGSGILGQRADTVFMMYDDEKLGLVLNPVKTRHSGADREGFVYKLTRNQFHQFAFEAVDTTKTITIVDDKVGPGGKIDL